MAPRVPFSTPLWIRSPPSPPVVSAPAWSRSTCWPTTSPMLPPGGYKADREFYGLYTASEQREQTDTGVPSSMPVIERPWTDHTQGMLHPTGNTLDIALDGKGFFAINGPSGPLYTRKRQLSSGHRRPPHHQRRLRRSQPPRHAADAGLRPATFRSPPTAL